MHENQFALSGIPMASTIALISNGDLYSAIAADTLLFNRTGTAQLF